MSAETNHYGWVCRKCDHSAGAHGRKESGPWEFFECGCGCVVTTEDPWYGIDRETFERRRGDLIPRTSTAGGCSASRSPMKVGKPVPVPISPIAQSTRNPIRKSE